MNDHSAKIRIKFQINDHLAQIRIVFPTSLAPGIVGPLIFQSIFVLIQKD